MAKTIRVYKSSGEWVAKRDGAANGRYFTTQKEAYLHARGVALNNGLTITVYYPTGGIKAVIDPRNRAEEESNCFLTTSCVKYFQLDDKCYELETLRKYRDKYLLKSTEGKELVNQYYILAPDLVKKLESSENRHDLFRDVFCKIQASCRAIENKDYEKAKEIYKSAVSYLLNHLKAI